MSEVRDPDQHSLHSRPPLIAMFSSALSKTVLNAAPRASRAAFRPALARGYHEKVISHYEQPRNVSARPVWPVWAFLEHSYLITLAYVGRLAPQERS
jgi:hypothetical protein